MENRFVLDVNIWFSIFYSRRTVEFIDSLELSEFEIICCNELVKEFVSILSYDGVKELLNKAPRFYTSFINEVAENYEPEKRFALLFDYKDNYLVDLAFQSNAILVTDDKGFDILKKMKRPKIKIISKKEFYKYLGW